jgi:hypothetical protein
MRSKGPVVIVFPIIRDGWFVLTHCTQSNPAALPHIITQPLAISHCSLALSDYLSVVFISGFQRVREATVTTVVTVVGTALPAT